MTVNTRRVTQTSL